MEIDLGDAGDDFARLAERLRSQVCIVGGGIAGLILAHRLMRVGASVTMLEAGGRTQSSLHGDDPFSAELQGVPHVGTHESRVCAFGGCSLTWGGQLMALPEDSTWPVSAAELRRQELDWTFPSRRNGCCGVSGADLPTLFRGLPELMPRFSRFIPFRERNLAQVPGAELLASSLVKVVLHACVTELALSGTGDRVRDVVARTPGGKLVRVQAEHYVVAAGTVETCRLLLASQSVAREGIGNAYGQVGFNFHDHLTLSAATFFNGGRARMLAELRPWVLAPREQICSLKLEPSAKLRDELGIQAAMAHLTIEEPEASGVGTLRWMLRTRQKAGARAALQNSLRAAPQIAVDAGRLLWEARVKHRRYVSPRASVHLQLNMAQDSPSVSRVRLSSQLDRYGMPKAVVDWRISRAELTSLRRFAVFLKNGLDAAGVRDGVTWEPALFEDGPAMDERLLKRIDDARHAMGGACMGTDPRASVVDSDLRVHGMSNLSIASAAVFPDGSAQLPTWTLGALCSRLAERLRAELAGA